MADPGAGDHGWLCDIVDVVSATGRKRPELITRYLDEGMRTAQGNAARMRDVHTLLDSLNLRWVQARSQAPHVPDAFDEHCVVLLDSDRPAALALARFLGQKASPSGPPSHGRSSPST